MSQHAAPPSRCCRQEVPPPGSAPAGLFSERRALRRGRWTALRLWPARPQGCARGSDPAGAPPKPCGRSGRSGEPAAAGTAAGTARPAAGGALPAQPAAGAAAERRWRAVTGGTCRGPRGASEGSRRARAGARAVLGAFPARIPAPGGSGVRGSRLCGSK